MIIIIHGWSDNSDSFRDLRNHLLNENIQNKILDIRLGDYVSLHDEITLPDIANALNKAMIRLNIPQDPRSIDFIVHSTGSLVVRQWMTQFFSSDTNPIRRLIMLAPANFGSPLAHKGRSFIGRAIKGFKLDHLFETGT
jgi:pimeloyl-ACP methyl ester carboxylesterase